MAHIDKKEKNQNEYQSRSAFMSDHSNGRGIEKHNRVNNPAENGRYISDKGAGKNAGVSEKSLAEKHIKHKAAENNINDKKSQTHYTQNNDEAMTNGQVSAGSDLKAESSQSVMKSQSERAAEIKEQLKREVAVDRAEKKADNAEKNSRFKLADKESKTSEFVGKQKKFKVESKESAAANRYIKYKENIAEYKSKKAAYKLKRKIYKLKTKKAAKHSLREIVMEGKDIARPFENGDTIGMATIPAKIYLKKILNKTAAGRLAVKSGEIGGRTINAAQSADSTSDAMQAVFSTAVKETSYTAADALGKEIKKVAKNKYMDFLNFENKYISWRKLRELQKIEEAKSAISNGAISDKLAKKIDKFSDRNTAAIKVLTSEIKNAGINRKIDRFEKKIKRRQAIEEYRKKHDIKTAVRAKVKFIENKLNEALKSAIKKGAKKIIAAIASAGIPGVAVFSSIFIIIMGIENVIAHPFTYITTKYENGESEQEAADEGDVIRHYHGVFDEIIAEGNDQIPTFDPKDPRNSTGVENPEKKAQYDAEYAVYAEQYDIYSSDYEYYCSLYPENHGDPPTEPEADYWFTEEELYNMGSERGPIWEGYRWSDETDGTKIPYGKLYNESLAALAAYNVKNLSTENEEETVDDTEQEEEQETEETEETEETFYMPPFEILDDDIAAAFYIAMKFWTFEMWDEDMNGCPAGGNCCVKLVEITDYDDDGNAVGTHQEDEAYCPGHYATFMELKFYFSMEETVFPKLNLREEDMEGYEAGLKMIEDSL